MPKLELRALKAKDCGPLRDVQIDFAGRPITVLGGANGSGKTTVLELIVALAQRIMGLYRFSLWDDRNAPVQEVIAATSVLDRCRYVQIDLTIGDQVFHLVGGQDSLREAPHESFGFVVDRTGQVRVVDTGIALALSRVLVEVVKAQQDLDLNDIPFAQRAERDLVPSILYFPHSRHLESVKGDQIHREQTPYRFVHRYVSLRSFAGSLDSYLIWLDYALPDLFREVIEFLNQLPFEGKTFLVDRKALKVLVRTPDGHTHGLEDLSSGEQNILILLLELRRRLLPGSLVLVDEIENSLHPAFQHRLAQGLRHLMQQVPFQLVLTTHARAFVDIFGAESTLLLTEF